MCRARAGAALGPLSAERLDPGGRQGPAGGRGPADLGGGHRRRRRDGRVAPWFADEPRPPASISSAARRTPRSAAARSGRAPADRAAPRPRCAASSPRRPRRASRCTVPEADDGPARRRRRRARSRSRSRRTPGRGVRGAGLPSAARGAHADGAGLPAHRRAPTSRARRRRRLLVRRRDPRLPGVGGHRRRPGDPLVLARRGRRLVAAGAGRARPGSARWCCTGRTRTPRGYRVQVSADGRTWRTAATVEDGRGGREIGPDGRRGHPLHPGPGRRAGHPVRLLALVGGGVRGGGVRPGRRRRGLPTQAPRTRPSAQAAEGAWPRRAATECAPGSQAEHAVDPGHRVVRAVRLQVRQPARVPMAGPDDAPGQAGRRGGLMAQPPADLGRRAGRP